MGWINSIQRPRSLVAVLITVFALAACGNVDRDPAEPSAEPGPRDPSAEEFLDDTLPDEASGTVVAARAGEIAHCQGFGLADREAKVAAGCNTAYDIMSMTKQFTAAAILKLEMMGKLRVTDPMSKFVGPVPDDKRAITVHHLPDSHVRADRPARAATTRRCRGRRCSMARWSPNCGRSRNRILLLQPRTVSSPAIVDKASGTSYEKFLASQLFEPRA